MTGDFLIALGVDRHNSRSVVLCLSVDDQTIGRSLIQEDRACCCQVSIFTIVICPHFGWPFLALGLPCGRGSQDDLIGISVMVRLRFASKD
jgi:hypothetical protein